MIARCDRCDDADRMRLGGQGDQGHRYTPPLSAWVCSVCGGALRGKRKGEDEANIIPARRKAGPA